MKNILCFSLLTIFITSCKYEDGPILSLTSSEKRAEGKYSIEYINENGIDQLYLVDSFKIISLNFYTTEAFDVSSFAFSATLADTSYHDSWWSFTDHNKKIVVNNIGCFTGGPPPVTPIPGFLTDGTCDTPPIVWEILKLTNKCMWLRTNFQDKEYEVHLKKL